MIALVLSPEAYTTILDTLGACWGCACEEGGHTWALRLIELHASRTLDNALRGIVLACYLANAYQALSRGQSARMRALGCYTADMLEWAHNQAWFDLDRGADSWYAITLMRAPFYGPSRVKLAP